MSINFRLSYILSISLFLLIKCYIISPHDEETRVNIDYDNLLVGQQTIYKGYKYTTMNSGEYIHEESGETLYLTVKYIVDDTVIIEQKTSGTDGTLIKLLKSNSGLFVQDSGITYPFYSVNRFDLGLLSEDYNYPIEFDHHIPECSTAVTVGMRPKHVLNWRVYRNVTVLADGSAIPVDGGGICYILSKEKILIQIIHYSVFGIDGGWEIKLQ